PLTRKKEGKFAPVLRKRPYGVRGSGCNRTNRANGRREREGWRPLTPLLRGRFAAEGDRECLLAVPARDGDLDDVARFVREEGVGQRHLLAEFGAVDRDDDVVLLDPGLGRRAVALNLADVDAVVRRQAEEVRLAGGELDRVADAEVGVDDVAG